MWFCPVRSQQYEAGVEWCRQNLTPAGAHTMANLGELADYVGQGGYGFAVLYHSWWVPRARAVSGGPFGGSPILYPAPSPNAGPWPISQSDPAAAKEPIMTDRCLSQLNPDPRAAGEGHQFAGKKVNLNLLFGDGHVETRRYQDVQMRYYGNYYHFY
jgi:prepilin-type processing-associated H-X9-DG protein